MVPSVILLFLNPMYTMQLGLLEELAARAGQLWEAVPAKQYRRLGEGRGGVECGGGAVLVEGAAAQALAWTRARAATKIQVLACNQTATTYRA